MAHSDQNLRSPHIWDLRSAVQHVWLDTVSYRGHSETFGLRKWIALPHVLVATWLHRHHLYPIG